MTEKDRPPVQVGPNWYAAVMGTGIVATAAATLPVTVPGLRPAATVVWLLAAALLLTLTVASAVLYRRDRERYRAYLGDAVMAHFLGAPPMAVLTVGAGALLLGPPLIGGRAAVAVSAVLWSVGTLAGLASAVAVPYALVTRHRSSQDSTYAFWLMPVVPPMVSAANGALLLPHVPAGQARLSALLACYAMFGLSLVASVVVITMVWSRLAYHDVGPSRMVPTLWIVLGPLGQSITAANQLGAVADTALPEPYAVGARVFGVLYGVPVWGFAALWFALAASLTVRAARQRLPFALTWWSFTFPVGTLVTGTTSLAVATSADVLRGGAVVLYCALVLAWATVAVRTAHGALRGQLLRPVQA